MSGGGGGRGCGSAEAAEDVRDLHIVWILSRDEPGGMGRSRSERMAANDHDRERLLEFRPMPVLTAGEEAERGDERRHDDGAKAS